MLAQLFKRHSFRVLSLFLIRFLIIRTVCLNHGFFLFLDHSFGLFIPQRLSLHLFLRVFHIRQVIVVTDIDHALNWFVLIVTVDVLQQIQVWLGHYGGKTHRLRDLICD